MIGLGLSNTKNEDERFVFHPKDISLCNFFLHSISKNVTLATGTENASAWNDENTANVDGPYNFTQATNGKQPTFGAGTNYLSFDGSDYMDTSSAALLHTVNVSGLGWTFVFGGSFDSYARERSIFGQSSNTDTHFKVKGEDAWFLLKAKVSGGTSTQEVELSPSAADQTKIVNGDYNGVNVMIMLTCTDIGEVIMYFNNRQGAESGDIGNRDIPISQIGAANGANIFAGTMRVFGAWKKQLNEQERTDVYNWFLTNVD